MLKALSVVYIALCTCAQVNAQASNAEYIAELESSPTPIVRTLSFKGSKKRQALTALTKTEADKEPQIYTAEISLDKDGASVFFRAYRDCTPTGNVSQLEERIIVVSGQKIQSYYLCGFGEADARTNEVYLMKSAAGRAFIVKEFSEKAHVFVRLRGLPIPFDTEGFSQAFASANGKAL